MFLANPAVNAGHLGQVDRAVLERYLAHLHAELAGRVVHRAMIGQLNRECNFNGVTPEAEGDTSDRSDGRQGAGVAGVFRG